jgi:hypothetical protein
MSRVNARQIEKAYRPRVVVKFTDDVRVPGEGDIEKYLTRQRSGRSRNCERRSVASSSTASSRASTPTNSTDCGTDH